MDIKNIVIKKTSKMRALKKMRPIVRQKFKKKRYKKCIAP